MARSTSSRAARVAGRSAASTPPSTAISAITTTGAIGQAERGETLATDGDADRPAEEDPDECTEPAPEQRDEDGLPPHGGAGLRVGHPDRTQQAQLVGALVDRQRHAVGDAEQGDEPPGRSCTSISTVKTFTSSIGQPPCRSITMQPGTSALPGPIVTGRGLSPLGSPCPGADPED